jgi:sulfur carrier protein
MDDGCSARPAGRDARPPQLQPQLQSSRGLRLLLRLILAKIVTMKIVINGQEQILAPITLALLIEQLGMKQDRVAVELNRDIVPRAKWTETNLAEGDRLEIVHFVGGGLS